MPEEGAVDNNQQSLILTNEIETFSTMKYLSLLKMIKATGKVTIRNRTQHARHLRD